MPLFNRKSKFLLLRFWLIKKKNLLNFILHLRNYSYVLSVLLHTKFLKIPIDLAVKKKKKNVFLEGNTERIQF